MLEIEIPKDISKYETKLIGPFTTRQTVCLAGAGGISIVLYNVLSVFNVDITTVMFAAFLFCTPFFLVGWVHPYGMSMEKFILHYLVYCYLAPAKRVYKTKNLLDETPFETENPKTKKGTKKKVKKKKIKFSKNYPVYY